MCECGGQTALGRFAAWGGDHIQNYAAKKFKNWTGYGDYNITANSLIPNISAGVSGQPTITTGSRSVRVQYREYLGEVTTASLAGAFNSTTYDVNPANVITFPWLSNIAQQFDQYKPHGIIFEFRSTATDTTTAASLGSVIMSTEYDVTDPTPASKQEMLNSAYSNEAKSSDSMLHGIECDPKELQRRVFYTRNLETAAGDVRDYDLCKTTIATQGGGLGANQSIGSLYIHYDIEFFKEQLSNSINAKGRLFSRCGVGSSANVGTDLSNLFGNGNLFTSPVGSTVSKQLGGVDMGIEIDGNTIRFPRKWQNATFRIDIIFNMNILYNFTTGINSSDTNCSIVTLSNMAGAPMVLFGDWYGVQTAGGEQLNGVHLFTYVKLNGVITDPFATISMTEMPGLPVGGQTGPNPWQATFLIETVPEDFP